QPLPAVEEQVLVPTAPLGPQPAVPSRRLRMLHQHMMARHDGTQSSRRPSVVTAVPPVSDLSSAQPPTSAPTAGASLGYVPSTARSSLTELSANEPPIGSSAQPPASRAGRTAITMLPASGPDTLSFESSLAPAPLPLPTPANSNAAFAAAVSQNKLALLK